jgi:hypothetical protein
VFVQWGNRKGKRNTGLQKSSSDQLPQATPVRILLPLLQLPDPYKLNMQLLIVTFSVPSSRHVRVPVFLKKIIFNVSLKRTGTLTCMDEGKEHEMMRSWILKLPNI